MKTSSRIMTTLTTSFSIGAALLMTGCSTTFQTRGETKPSAFLSNPAQLHEGQSGEAKLVYVNPKADFRKYNKILLDPVALAAQGATSSAFASMSKEQQQAMVNYVDAIVREKLKGDYTFVTQPGPDVMRLRICITEAQGATIVLDTLSSIVPIGVALNVVKTAVTGKGLSVGEAGVEMELKDSVSGERLAAAVDERAGRKYTLRADKFSRYRTFDDAYEFWATRLQERLAQMRAPKAAPVGK